MRERVQAVSEREATELLNILEHNIKSLSEGKQRAFSAMINRWACQALGDLVATEIESLTRIAEKLRISLGDRQLLRLAYGRAVWFLWLDQLVLLRLKKKFLEGTRSGQLRHYIADGEVVALYKQRIVPLLEQGWNISYEDTRRSVVQFRDLLLGDSAAAAVPGDIKRFVELPDESDWNSYMQFAKDCGL